MNLQLIENKDRTCTIVIDGQAYGGSCQRSEQRVEGVRLTLVCEVEPLVAPDAAADEAPADEEAQDAQDAGADETE